MASLRSIWGRSSDEDELILVRLRQMPSKAEMTRIEDIQLAVTTVIISVYISKTSSGNSIFPTNYPLPLVTIFPVVFLLGKLLLATTRPYYDNIWLKRVDFVFLPFFFAGSFLGGGGLLVTSIIDISLPQMTPLVQIVDEIANTYLYGVRFITLYLLAIITLSAVYAWWSGRAMSVIESKVPEIRFTFTSGSSDSSLPLRLENTTPDQIDPSDVEIQIWTEECVEVTRIDGATSLSEGVWKPLIPIASDSGMTLEMHFERADGASEISDSEATVEIRLRDTEQQRHRVLLRG